MLRTVYLSAYILTVIRRGGNGHGQPDDAPASEGVALRALVSQLIRRSEFATNFGLQFGGKRDLFTTLGYPSQLNFPDYWSRFQRGDIAERLCQILPSAVWVDGIYFQEDPDPGTETPFERDITAIFEKFDLWSKILEADILANIGQYSVLLIGGRNSGEFSTPLLKLSADNVLYISAHSEENAKIERIIENEADPRFGLPESYNLSVTTRAGPIVNSISKIVHHTRVVHIANNCLGGEVYGTPYLCSIWNRLMDLDKIIGGGAESTWRRMSPPTLFNTESDEEITESDITKFKDEVDEMQHGLRDYMLTRNVKPSQLTSNVTTFGPNANSIIEIIAGSKGVPIRILMGSERGELASTQDTDHFNDVKSSYIRRNSIRTLRRIADRFIELGIVAKPSDPYEIIWPDEEELNEKEKAQVVSNISSANSSQSNAGDTIILTSSEIRNRYFKMEPLEDSLDSGDPLLNDKDVADGDDSADDSADDSEGNVQSDTSNDSSARAASRQQTLIRRVAASNIEPVARAISSIWRTAAASIDESALEESIVKGDHWKAAQLVEIPLSHAEKSLTSMLQTRLLSVVDEAGLSALRSARGRGAWLSNADSSNVSTVRGNVFTADFTTNSPRAIRYAETRSSQLITEIGPATRESIRNLIAEGLRDGIPPRRLARQVVSMIGLRSDQTTAVLNLERRLRNAKPGTLVMAGKTRIRVPSTGISETLISSRSAQYAARLRNQRAVLISRTETMRSANVGQKELWRQAIDVGALPASQKREWLTAEDDDVRLSHDELNGERVGIDEPFSAGIEPGEEPNCRCSQGLVDESVQGGG